ncbi:hypothetical protein K7H92_21030 [Pseudomonas stutzeri]|nr:hypothetical protein [Stutzerimonas stutzeri]
MLNKLLESLSAALLLTAASYAAGVVQTKSFFRAFGIQPELISIDIEKALYDGGLIVFVYSSAVFFAMLVIAAFVVIGILLLSKSVSLGRVALYAGKIFPAALIFIIYFITTYSYGDGQARGEKLAAVLKHDCALITVKTDDHVYLKKCSLAKTNGFIWVYDKKQDKAIAIAEDQVKEIVAED